MNPAVWQALLQTQQNADRESSKSNDQKDNDDDQEKEKQYKSKFTSYVMRDGHLIK